MNWFLRLCATHGKACLVIGLLAGLLLPRIAAQLQPWLPQMVAGLLTITALRIGWDAAMGALQDMRWGIAMVIALQLGVPLTGFAALWLVNLHQSPAALAFLLATAAPAISGSPNLALMLGLDAGRMMQILILGTASFAITVLPLLALIPDLGSTSALIGAALRVLLVILCATALGFGLRAWLLPHPTQKQSLALDGASVLAFSSIVVGLMAALTPALRHDPLQVAQWAALAFAIGYGLQLLTLVALRKSRLRSMAGPLALGAGNRNIALFLVALPPDVMAPLLVFVGCWQIPMYLTPILLPRLYKWALRDD